MGAVLKAVFDSGDKSRSEHGFDDRIATARKESGNPFALPKTPEQERKAAEGNLQRKEILKSSGVKVEKLTKAKMRADALAIANGTCGLRVDENMAPSRLKVDWSNLTKTGKVPKKVAESHVVFDWPDRRSLIVHVWYLATMEPYAADVYAWVCGECKNLTIRTVDGDLAIQHESCLDAESGVRNIIS